jgi:hypothetical protein
LFNSGFIQAAVYIVRPMITYRSVELGEDSALVGAVGATFALAPLLFAIPIGRWVDRGRAGFALFAGAGISLLTAFALLFINSIPLLMLAMPMLGIGHLLTMVGGQTMIANRSQDAKLEKNFGLLTFYASLGQAIGPFTGGVLADTGTIKVDTNSAIGFAAVLFAFAVITTIPLVRGSKAEAAKVAGNTRGSVREVLGLPNFKSAIFVASAITAVIDVVLIFLPLLGRELGLTTTEVGACGALAVIHGCSLGTWATNQAIRHEVDAQWRLDRHSGFMRGHRSLHRLLGFAGHHGDLRLCDGHRPASNHGLGHPNLECRTPRSCHLGSPNRKPPRSGCSSNRCRCGCRRRRGCGVPNAGRIASGFHRGYGQGFARQRLNLGSCLPISLLPIG